MKKILLLLSITFLLTILCISTYTEFTYAAAVNNFDSVNVLEDLESSSIDGVPFKASNYPKDPYGKLTFITFAEYCYSQYDNAMDNYSLYIYIYNPLLLNLSESMGLNTIQLATSFDDSGNATGYSKFQISLCNKTSDKLFYKYKVIDKDNKILNSMKEYSRKHNGIRKYSIGEMELLTYGSYNADAYNIGRTYEYSGFASGYGNAEFHLACEVYDLETIKDLECHYTFYRPSGENTAGSYTQDQLNSIYFAIPNEKINKYGIISAIYCEWYEYLTKEAFVVGNEAVYNSLKGYIGQTISPYDHDVYYGLAANYSLGQGSSKHADYIYNSTGDIAGGTKSNMLSYLFPTYGADASTYTVSSKEIIGYWKKWSDVLGSKTINGKYSDKLFYNSADTGRKAGYNDKHIRADDGYSLTSYKLNQNFWSLLGIKNYTKTSYSDIEAIHTVLPEDFIPNNKDAICSKLYIDKAEYDDFKAFYDKETSKESDKTVFIMRFAVTDYISKPVQTFYGQNILGAYLCALKDTNAYMFQQTAFIDFDIIDVTFYKDGVYTVIPVVSSPIDAVGAGTPPVNTGEKDKGCSLLQIILMLLALFLILYLFGPYILKFIEYLIRIITYPFKLIFGGKK